MKANCLFCYMLDPTKGYGETSLGECGARKKNIHDHHKNCTTFKPFGPYYAGWVDWLRRKAEALNRVASMVEEEAPEFYASQVTHEKRPQEVDP